MQPRLEPSIKIKRKTTQVRILQEWYLILKEDSEQKHITISKNLDQIMLKKFGIRRFQKIKERLNRLEKT